MGQTSKELLQLEHKNTSTSQLESALLVNKSKSSSQTKKQHPEGKAQIAPIPKSQVLGKVKDFLGVISEANERLQFDAKDSSKNYDIEVLTGNESEIIEMDLMLGIAELHTPEAVAAAECAISGLQPVIQSASSSSESESDGSSVDDDNSSDEDDADSDGKRSCPFGKKSKSVKDNFSKEGNHHSKKRSKIVELS
ncbi:DVA-1 polyprotein [Quillaja saponaria]|uniref:DVA-1 polyprotein n=1 Tax=Quillaja saponaria TaxID=32244 RepID=A0AAD7PUE8_QUISA|nr:DVA-1 polyprotein [Quillaja saponaria]